jgi:hypothetical protein
MELYGVVLVWSVWRRASGRGAFAAAAASSSHPVLPVLRSCPSKVGLGLAEEGTPRPRWMNEEAGEST